MKWVWKLFWDFVAEAFVTIATIIIFEPNLNFPERLMLEMENTWEQGRGGVERHFNSWFPANFRT